MWPPIILGEWFLGRQEPYGGNRTNVVLGVGLLYGVLFAAIYWVYLLTYYQLSYSIPVILGSFALILVACVLGGYLGSVFGERLRPLLD